MKLPINCSVEYFDSFLSKSECETLFYELTETYRIDQLKTKISTTEGDYYTDYGKLMFIDEDLFNANKFPEDQWGKNTVWSNQLLGIKQKVEEFTGKAFQVCVCIYYPDGNSGVGFHSDYVAFGDTNYIPSLSIGEEREFHLRENETSDIYEVKLLEGSLLIMGENCQQRYEHSLPLNPKYKDARINLTFRQFGF